MDEEEENDDEKKKMEGERHQRIRLCVRDTSTSHHQGNKNEFKSPKLKS